MKIGVQTYSSWHAATQRQEDHHGPHNHMLPQSGVPRQRTKRPREHWHPLVQGQALHLHGVPQDMQRHERHRLLSPADLCGDGQPRADTHGPRMSTASDRGGLWVRRADGGGMGDTRRRPRPGRPGASGGATKRPGAGTSGCNTREQNALRADSENIDPFLRDQLVAR